MYCGDSQHLLKSKRFQKKYKSNIQLVFTSPPFPLHEQKYMATTPESNMLNGWPASLALFAKC
jgi:hypothetical protein